MRVSSFQGIVDEIYQLPISTPLPSHLIQRISRLAGAYLENLGQKGKVSLVSSFRIFPH